MTKTIRIVLKTNKKTKNEKLIPFSSNMSYTQRRNKRDLKRTEPDVDKLSFVGSTTSDMSTSVLEKRLDDAQKRINLLETVTEKQQAIIMHLKELVEKKTGKKVTIG
jgi:hypothetical protein